jgi:hypothetical protein
MKTKSMLLTAAVAFAGMAAFIACDKQDDENQDITPPPSETPIKIKVANNQTNDTLRIDYNGTLDLSAIFSLEQAQGGTATLTYIIDRQPDFVEGTAEEYTSVEAYRVTGNLLTSIQGIRVPDTVNVPADNRLRVVREGKLKVSTAGSDTTFTIIQTGKPELVPTIALDPEITGLNNGTLTLTTTGQPRSFNATAFTISPIDFGISDIKIGIGAGDDYITISEYGGVPRAGGSTGTPGTGGYIVAYHKNNTLEEVLTDETLPQARLYINVTYVAPNAIVGIVANTEAIGTTAAASFWKLAQKSTISFVKAKLNDGTIVAYSSSDHGSLLSGNFNANTKGAGTENTSHPGWYPNVQLESPLPEVGAEISWTITHSAHFEEDGWTVIITTTRLAEQP